MIDCKRFIDLMRGSWYSSSRADSSPPLETRITNGGDTDDRPGLIASGTSTHSFDSSAEETYDLSLDQLLGLEISKANYCERRLTTATAGWLLCGLAKIVSTIPTTMMTGNKALRCTWMRSSYHSRGSNTASRALATHSLHMPRTGGREHLLRNRFPVRRLYSTLQTAEPGVSHTLQDHSLNTTTATITISNSSKLNILNSALLDQLAQTCKSLSANPTLRAVVLTGGPTKNNNGTPSFIGGADIKEMYALKSSSEAREFILKVHGACQELRDIPVPVIAKIDGVCLGAGLEIAVSCDLRIATERSSFAMPEVRVGIPSVVEAALLPGLIGMGRTRRLLYLAEIIGTVEAERWGLVDKVVGDEGALEKAVDEWVEGICEMGPLAMRSQKKLMLGWENSTVDEGIQAGVEAFADAYADGQEPRDFMGKFVNRKR